MTQEHRIRKICQHMIKLAHDREQTARYSKRVDTRLAAREAAKIYRRAAKLVRGCL